MAQIPLSHSSARFLWSPEAAPDPGYQTHLHCHTSTKLQKLQHIRAGTSVQLDEYGTTSSTVVIGSILQVPATAGRSVSLSAGSCRPRRAASSTTLVSRLWFPELCMPREQRLFSGSRNGGVVVPCGIGEMMALHNISVIDVSVASGRAILEEIKNLTQLRKLGVSGIKVDNHKELCSVISDHAHLKSLSMWLDKNQAGCLDAVSHPPEGLQSLKLYGCVDKLPEWIKLLSNLIKLKLQMDMITRFEVNQVLNLPSLHNLCLHPRNFEYGELRFTGSGIGYIRQLMVLEIACNSRLQSITFESYLMPRLEVLKICCYHVSYLEFIGLDDLYNLREVSLGGSFHNQVNQPTLGQQT